MLKIVIGKGIVSLILSFLAARFLSSQGFIDFILIWLVCFVMIYAIATLFLFEMSRRGIIVGAILAFIALMIGAVVIGYLQMTAPIPPIVSGLIVIMVLAIPLVMDLIKLIRE